MYTLDTLLSDSKVNNNHVVTKKEAELFMTKLLADVPHGIGINNQFFTEFLDPLSPAPAAVSLHIMLQNWLEQKRILRRSLVQGLEAVMVAEYWPGQMAYLELLQDEIQGKHVDLAWESLSQIAMAAGIELPHSVDAQNSPLITAEMKDLRSWQAEDLRADMMILVAVAIFERQSQPVLRRTYQALQAWFVDKLNEQQRQSFDRYFAVHTCITDICKESSFADIVINIPNNSGVEQKHAQITGDCFVNAKTEITVQDLKQAAKVYALVNEYQNRAWTSVYKQCVASNSF